MVAAAGGDEPPDRTDNLILLPGLRPAELGDTRRPPAAGLQETEQPTGPPPDPGEGLAYIPTRTPDPARMAAAVEAVLFSLSEPLSLARLLDILDQPDESDVSSALALVQARYERADHGLRLVEVAGGWQLRTHPRFARWCARAQATRPVRLSRAALETVAIVAYQQPVTRSEVEKIRGVDPGGILRTLVERGLVRSLGHRDEPGRPLLYGTTPRFLELFGLRDLSDLPTLRDLRELKEDDPEAQLRLPGLLDGGEE